MRIAATVLALAIALPTIGSAGDGRYQGFAVGTGVFVIDTKTGKVRFCRANYRKPPICSAWSKED